MKTRLRFGAQSRKLVSLTLTWKQTYAAWSIILALAITLRYAHTRMTNLCISIQCIHYFHTSPCPKTTYFQCALNYLFLLKNLTCEFSIVINWLWLQDLTSACYCLCCTWIEDHILVFIYVYFYINCHPIWFGRKVVWWWCSNSIMDFWTRSP